MITDFSQNLRPMFRYAKRKHDDTHAVRKGSGLPYFTHPETVAKILQAYGASELEQKAGLAHDLIEDAGVTSEDIEEKFGEKVKNIINELTNDTYQISQIGKKQYMNEKLIHLSKQALTVKLADMYHNICDNSNESLKNRIISNIDYLMNSNRKLTDIQLELIAAIYNSIEIL